ncbi:hypothetical protein OQH61_01210 [Helicobacter sp. MIT 21-1697]|uniref:outer membrane beta-barrel protein n=1 Tax=Helicobacter sp. MIT 21-1697 TaxID=2993733 RepID=UPI00224B6CAC|nr:hypothetical protein [Helicobacter sp. MIT 21-1697]MCX2716359.1 hypothetical protein [Helicobacter sp. MIT 21-1697]
MRKYLLSLLCVAGLSQNVQAGSFAGFEISPEIGFAAGQTKTDNAKFKDYSAFGRIWLGAFDFVVAPQIKYDFNSHSNSDADFRNLQYGISAGYNIGIIVARLTPYVGVNYSSFNKTFKDTVAYNAGLKLKFDFIPISLGLLYTYQNPELNSTTTKEKMQTIQALIGLHF